MNAKQFFEENGYVLLSKFIDNNMSSLLYQHVINSCKVASFLNENFTEQYKSTIYGSFTDIQALGDYSRYGDLIFDTLLELSLPNVEKILEKKLLPTYSYHRLYTTNTELKRHKDRPSCELSATLCLGYNVKNLECNEKNYNWPMFVGPSNGETGTKGTPVHMNPGDIILYKGCLIEHWREPFKGLNHAQVFLHYNEVTNNTSENLYDNRPLLGLNETFKKGNIPFI